MLGFDALASFPLGGIPSSARTDVLTAASGSYVVTGNASSGGYGEAAQSGSYAITGNAAGMAFTAGSGSYALTGTSATARMPVESGSYAITGHDALFTVTLAAESGSYTLTLGEYTLRRTGDDIDPGVYGIGHIKLAMEEARRLSRVVKPPPHPVISRPPRLVPQLAAPVVQPLPIGGLIDNSNLLDHMAAQRQQMAAQQATEAQQQARRRAVAVLLLAA
jgi:hypothetical protein